MNKKLVAVAVAGMLAAPMAAQAQTANVTLYGRLNLDMEVVNAKQDQTYDPPTSQNGFPKENIFRVKSDSSRLGVRGSEALGGGLPPSSRSNRRSAPPPAAGWAQRWARAKPSSACKAAGVPLSWATS